MKVTEKMRRVISNEGHQVILEGVTEVDNTGSWTRMKDNRGRIIIVNPDSVLMYIITPTDTDAEITDTLLDHVNDEPQK